jgi:hypothetical protein
MHMSLGRGTARPLRRLSRHLGALLCVCALAPAAAAAWPNPADHPSLLDVAIEESSYDHATRCRPRTTPGIRLLTAWVDRHFPGESWGVYRCERLSKTTRSLHSEGRALDWRLDARNGPERRAANFMIERFLVTDERGNEHALARRMGIQELIFNCRSWWAGSDGLATYSACEGKGRVDRTTAHRDHVHIGLNRAGARAKTSFWRSALSAQ